MDLTKKLDLGIPELTISQAKKILLVISKRIASSGKQAVMLWGPPGIGKSDLVRELARDTNRNLVDIRLSTIDPVDLRGLPQINSTEFITHWLPPDFLPRADSKPGILFLDEINAASPSIQASAYQLILDRKLGTYSIPKNWLVIAAGNRISDRSVTYRIPTALANRFTHLEIIADPQEWYAWAWQNEIDPLIISFLKYHPNLLLKFDPDEITVAFPTPRSWAFASSLQDLRSIDLELYLRSLQGTVGKSAAQQFQAFISHQDKLADPKDIIEGREYVLPSTPDAQYILLGSLVQALIDEPTSEHLTNFFNYVEQFSNGSTADYAVILVKELIGAYNNSPKKYNDQPLSQHLANHPSFKAWVSDHIDLIQ